MTEQVADIIRRLSLFTPAHHVAVAVSGGADSVALLHVLLLIHPQLSVAHVNHHLRGAESDADEAFVARLAAQHGLPFHVFHVAVDPDDNLEQSARAARYRALATLLDRGVDRIALGHTRSDQAETVLFRFLRGAATAGLAGIRPVSRAFVRPLLDLARPEIEAWLRSRDLTWREDPSNTGDRFARNRIRHQLLPELERDWNPSLTRTLARTAQWAEAEEDYWRAELDRLQAAYLTVRRGAVYLRTGELTALHPALQRRLLRRALELVRGDLRSLDFDHIEAVRHLASRPAGSGRIQLPGLDAFRSFDQLRLAPPGRDRAETRDFCWNVPIPGELSSPDANWHLSFEFVENANVYNGFVNMLDRDFCPEPLQLRNWRPGDEYQPAAGAAHAVRLKELFERNRIPLWERRSWPVLTSGGRIVWARRFGPSVDVSPGADTRSLLRIQEMHVLE